ncbi:MAG: O-antigen ligase family protein [Moorellales bacterium]
MRYQGETGREALLLPGRVVTMGGQQAGESPARASPVAFARALWSRSVWREQNYAFLVLLSAVGLLPLFHNGYQHPATRWVGFAVAAATFWAAGGEPKYKSLSTRPATDVRVFAAVLAYVLWAGGSVFWSVNRTNSLGEWFYLGTYGSAFYLAYGYLSRQEAAKLVRFLVIFGSLLSVAGIAEYLLLNPGRIVATFINPNPLGGYLAMLCLLALPRWLTAAENGRGRCFLFGGLGAFAVRPALSLALLLMLTGLALTGSRGAWMAFAFGSAALFILRPRARSLRVGCAFGLLLAVVALVAVGLAHIAAWLQQTEGARWLAGRLLEANLIRAESFGSSSVGGRLSFWGVALREAAARLLTGFGLGNYHEVYFLYWPGDEFYSKYAHNHYLQTAADLGLPGAILLALALSLLATALWGRVRRLRAHPLPLGLFASCLAFLFHSGVDFTWDMPAVTLTFWVLAGTALGLSRNHRVPTGMNRYRVAFRAVALATALLAVHAWVVDHYLNLGVEAAREGESSRALASWQKVEVLAPWSPAPWYYRSRLWTGEPNRGERAAAEAVRRSPYDKDLRLILARFQEQLGHMEAAEENLRLALSLGGYYPGPHLTLGQFYLRQARWSEAEEVMARGLALKDFALARSPNAEETARLEEQILGLRLGLSRAYAEQGRFEAAVQQLTEVLRAHPNHEAARQLLERYRAQAVAASEQERLPQTSNGGY